MRVCRPVFPQVTNNFHHQSDPENRGFYAFTLPGVDRGREKENHTVFNQRSGQEGPAGLPASAGTATRVSISIRSARFNAIFSAFSSGASKITRVLYRPGVQYMSRI